MKGRYRARTGALSLVMSVSCGVAWAAGTDDVPRPQARPGAGSIVLASAETDASMSRPEARPAAVAASAPVSQVDAAGFDAWVQGFRGRALAAGISASVFDRAFRGVTLDADVIARDQNQSEFVKPIWDYLDSAVSPQRVSAGQAALQKYAHTLDAIEARYGVDRQVVVAIWGMESNYGTHRGATPIIPALATLAYEGRRADFFEDQLIAALKIVQSGDISAQAMTGSWAGAMGHTQFMPTSYLQYAVDFNGDGRRDIWSDDPTDALASTAAYLAKSGWSRGQPWGVEVLLPRGFDYRYADRTTTLSVAQWTQLGVRGTDGRAVPNYGNASLLLPAGAHGPAFMTFGNFKAIARYNAADSYVIAVGHLSDEFRGRGDFVTPWPRGERSLAMSERKELQVRLTDAGFSTSGTDGRIGPNTVSAIRRYQVANGLIPDGYPSASLLDRLR